MVVDSNKAHTLLLPCNQYPSCVFYFSQALGTRHVGSAAAAPLGLRSQWCPCLALRSIFRASVRQLGPVCNPVTTTLLRDGYYKDRRYCGVDLFFPGFCCILWQAPRLQVSDDVDRRCAQCQYGARPVSRSMWSNNAAGGRQLASCIECYGNIFQVSYSGLTTKSLDAACLVLYRAREIIS